MSDTNPRSSCQFCQNERFNPLLNWGRFTISECSQCRVVFASPLPSDEELNAFYQGFLFNQPKQSDIDALLSGRKKELKTLFHLTGTHAGRRFLDVGGGTGMAYKAAKELGLVAFYQDLDDQAKNFTKEHFGLTDEFIIDALETSETTFDYVFSDNVIEHVKHPIAFANLLYSKLAKGGTLVIKTPNARNTEMYFNPIISIKGYIFRAMKDNSVSTVVFLIFKRFWHCDPPRHLYSFSAESFNHLVARMNHNDIEHSISYYRTPWFSNTISKWFFKGDMASNPVKSILIRCFIWPILPIEITLQTLKWLFLELGVVSPGGLILTIKRSK